MLNIRGYSMDIKNSFNLTDILIGILAVLAIIFFIGVFFGLNEVWHNPILLKKSVIELVASFSNVLIALISIIILLINKKHNEKTIRQTNELIKQNEENLFIQLRYADAHRAINDLIKYIEATFGIYEQLVDLEKSNIPEKEEYLSPRAFLVMQFINIISNYELLIKLPVTLRVKIESGFLDFTGENFEILRDNTKFNKILEEKGFINDYESSFKIIRLNKLSKSIQNNIAYNKFIDEFNSTEDIEMNEVVFKYYYGFKNIKTEDFYNHFDNIHNELTTNSTAKLILNDFLE